MNINETIKQTLDDYKITHQDGIPYLLAVFFGYKPTYVPDLLKKKIAATGIYTVLANGSIDWKISLFEETMDGYEWVKEYVAVFKKLNPSAPGAVAESTRRFKVFFAKHPEYTVQDVKGAFNLFVKSLSDPKYVGFPHYFINKDGVSALEMWVETYRQGEESAKQRVTKTKTMQ